MSIVASDEMAGQPEEPPDETLRAVAGKPLNATFFKSVPFRTPMDRRESLLTRQLHASEGDSHDEDVHPKQYAGRALSTSSIAELTSDNDLTSPGTRCSTPSPPLPATFMALPITPLDKLPPREPVIVEHEEPAKPAESNEKAVETGLGRRRCITFACGGKPKDVKEPVKVEEKKPEAEAPKRKCALTFVCPMRTKTSPQKPSPIAIRHTSPAPKAARSPRNIASKSHRNSDVTVTNGSPVTLRKVPSVIKRCKTKYIDAEDEETREAKRFHEFEVNSKANDEWTEMSTCHRKPLTVRDTLAKENVIRQLGQEVEDEIAEDDEEAILDELDAEEDIDKDDEDDDEDAEEEDDDEVSPPRLYAMAQAGDNVSDRGFSTDDEHGFANSSEDEDGDSDYEWWAPGRSTAATSTDQIDLIRPTHRRKMSDSSLESAREANGIVLKRHKKAKAKSAAINVNRPPTPELPDSTDFVCGTLDEDRPLEQAYIQRIQQRKQAKQHVTAQDIDPTFPTSDPDMDEEDEVDEGVASDEDDDQQLFLHGNMEMNDERSRRGREKAAVKKRSPNISPRRLRSPPPPASRAAHRSPAPAGRRTSLRSPPPPTNRTRRRSPPPRKLFGHSPHRLRSPVPGDRPTSPPNSCASSVEGTPVPKTTRPRTPGGLGSRPALTMTASLPRVPTMTNINQLAEEDEDEDEDRDESTSSRRHRGAIDIVKGLEKKRQRRKEKLYQKHCQKAKKDTEIKRCKPGKGAERMREIGLELAAYRSKTAEHILSI